MVEMIACTLPDWVKFVKTFEAITGESPTRELDKRNIPVGDPGSYAMALERINNRLQAIGNLSNGYRSLDFVDFTFLVHFNDRDDLSSFCNLLDITHMQFMDGSKGYVLFKGSVRQLRDLILVGNEIELYRPIFNRMYDLLSACGFRSLFGMKKSMRDGTFMLVG